MTGLLPSLSPLERTLVVSIAGLFLLVALLICYALLLRITYNRNTAHTERRMREWEPLVLEYLQGESVGAWRFGLKQKEWLIFGEFIGEYLENLDGTEHERLVELLRAIPFAPILMRAARSQSHWQRAYAIQFLGRIRYAPARPILLASLGDRSPVVSLSAFEALQLLGGQTGLPAIIRNIAIRNDLSVPKVSEIIAGFGPDAYPALISLLGDDELPETGKRLLVDILADERVTESIPAILDLLSRSYAEELVIGCIKALGALEAVGTQPVLAGFLSAPNWVVRGQAVKALGKIGTAEDIPLLANTLHRDDNLWVRTYCVQALLVLGPAGREAIETFARGAVPHPEIESIMEYTLSEFNG